MTRSRVRAATGFMACAATALLLAGCGSSSRGTTAAGSADSADSAGSTAAGLHATVVRVPKGLDAAPFDTTRRLDLPAGWHALVWSRVDGARLETWTPDRRLLVSRPDHGDIVELTPRLHRTPTTTTLVANLDSPHGMAFHGATLWVAERDEIDTFTYAKGRVTNRHVVIGNLPGGSGTWSHDLKSVVVTKYGIVYFSIGSSGNISAGDRSADPQAAVIMRYDPTTRRATVFARGVRNGTGLAVDPSSHIWTAMNNRDQLPYPYHRAYDTTATGAGGDDYGKVITSYVGDHPLEPVAELSPGRDLGWPYCDPDPDVHPGVEGTPLAYTDRHFVDDPDTNPTGSNLDCATLQPIEQGLPAHSAPLGMSFATLPKPYGTGALIGAHGSWDRTPPRAPEVWFLPWSARTGLGAARVIVGGFQNADGSRWGRAVAAVRGPDGALYVSDDQANAIYRITAY